MPGIITPTPRLVTGLHLLALVVIAATWNKIVPHPYMDEIFHIPQAQRYCEGDFWTWDPKLTTPPGLYAMLSSSLKSSSALMTISL
ncbi:hypothetical protein BGX21_006942 [Mortierella sp. AD011]|nr:hypothetical protein BGX21_006942 [Mortierella sp. AD011]